MPAFILRGLQAAQGSSLPALFYSLYFYFTSLSAPFTVFWYNVMVVGVYLKLILISAFNKYC